MNKPKSVFNWSGGKDSALALYHVLKEGQLEIDSLLTTVNSAYRRISMHGVREEFLYEQGKAIGLPIRVVELPEMPSMLEYNAIMDRVNNDLKKNEVFYSISGDIFLKNLRKYKEKRLKAAGLEGHFPLWGKNTNRLVREFIDVGFKAVVVCANGEMLGKDFIGRVIDEDFLKDLPTNVDPCGENGEFHSFVFDGPIFRQPIKYKLGEKVFKEYKAPKSADDNCSTSVPSKKRLGFHFIDIIQD